MRVLSPELTAKEGEAAEEGQPGPTKKRVLGETCKKRPLTSCLSTSSASLQRLRRGLPQSPPAGALLRLLQQVGLRHSLQHMLLEAVLDITPHQNLILEEAGLLNVTEVHLAHAAEVFVQELHRSVHRLQPDEFIDQALHGAAEIEAGVSFIDDFEVLLLQEAAHHGLASQNDLHKLPSRLLSRRVCCGQAPFLQPQLLRPAGRLHEAHRLAAGRSACPSSATVGPKSSFKSFSSPLLKARLLQPAWKLLRHLAQSNERSEGYLLTMSTLGADKF